MAFSFLYLAVRALLGALVRSRRGLDVKDIELLVLRHELEILRRQVARPKLGVVDRALLAAAAAHLPRCSRSVLLVTPRTLLRWHRALVRRKWRQPSGRAGQPDQHDPELARRRQLPGTGQAASLVAYGRQLDVLCLGRIPDVLIFTRFDGNFAIRCEQRDWIFR